MGFVQGEDPLTTSVSGRPDDLAWRCSSDTFDINGRAFESSENWAVLSTEGNKPVPRFDVSNHIKISFCL
jgi:hypothetical protein